MIFSSAKWIWINEGNSVDEYAEFYDALPSQSSAKIRISADSDYALFINGVFVDSNQFGDFEHYKIYDEIDISSHLTKEENSLSILVWHLGKTSSRYAKATAGLIYEVEADGKIISESSAKTRARKSPAYENGREKEITPQLGLGFGYDATREDGALFTGEGFGCAVEVNKSATLYKRIGEKLRLLDGVRSKSITRMLGGRYHLVDLGEETVGLLSLRFTTALAQKIRIDWGEDLQDGHVRRLIGARDFSVDYTAREGLNDYTNYMLRFGARYLEIYSEEPISIDRAGLIVQYYPTVTRSVTLENELDQRIYDLCTNTLRLSMMEHYVDCPWREQALYAFDSRNQMLSGYYAFENKNSEYVKANLSLILEDRRYNDLLSICYPTSKRLAIPSFSLHAITAITEYYLHTGDTALLKKAYPKLLKIINTFRGNIEDGLVNSLTGDDHWNFYDWSDYLDGDRKSPLPKAPDAVLTLLYAMSLGRMETIAEAIGETFPYKGEGEELLSRAHGYFLNKEDGLFIFRRDLPYYTELVNSLAILSGAVKGAEAERIAEAITRGETTESSLSIKCFTYDALLLCNREKYTDYVISEIRKNYKLMLDAGATSAWETIKCASDFAGAGSLCHGWSAIPVYYYHTLGMVKEN